MVRSRLAALKLEPSQADAGRLSGSGNTDTMNGS